MSTKDIIEALCQEKGITIAKLERDLDFSNGSLSKTDNIRSDRLLAVAKYFNVSMEFLMGEAEFIQEELIINNERLKIIPFKKFIEDFNPDTFYEYSQNIVVNTKGFDEYMQELTILKKMKDLPENTQQAIKMLLGV